MIFHFSFPHCENHWALCIQATVSWNKTWWMSLPPCIESSINVRQNLSNWFFVFETCRRVAQQCLCVLTLNLRYTSLAVHRGGLGPLLPIVSLNLTQRVLNANYDEKWQWIINTNTNNIKTQKSEKFMCKKTLSLISVWVENVWCCPVSICTFQQLIPLLLIFIGVERLLKREEWGATSIMEIPHEREYCDRANSQPFKSIL